VRILGKLFFIKAPVNLLVWPIIKSILVKQGGSMCPWSLALGFRTPLAIGDILPNFLVKKQYSLSDSPVFFFHNVIA